MPGLIASICPASYLDISNVNNVSNFTNTSGLTLFHKIEFTDNITLNFFHNPHVNSYFKQGILRRSTPGKWLKNNLY